MLFFYTANYSVSLQRLLQIYSGFYCSSTVPFSLLIFVDLQAMSNSDNNGDSEDRRLQLNNVLKSFASLKDGKDGSKLEGVGQMPTSDLQRSLENFASCPKKLDVTSKRKVVDRKVTALDEYMSEKDLDINDGNGKLDDLRDEICVEFAEILHKKCRKRVQNIVVDEQTGLLLRRALTALQTGKDVDGPQDTGAPTSGFEIGTAEIDPSGNPVLFSQSIVITQQSPGNVTSTISYRRKISANQMKRTPTNRLTKYD